MKVARLLPQKLPDEVVKIGLLPKFLMQNLHSNFWQQSL